MSMTQLATNRCTAEQQIGSNGLAHSRQKTENFATSTAGS